MKLQSFYGILQSEAYDTNFLKLKEELEVSDVDFSIGSLRNELESRLNKKYRGKEIIIYQVDPADINVNAIFFASVRNIIVGLPPRRNDWRGVIEIDKKSCKKLPNGGDISWDARLAELEEKQYHKILQIIENMDGKEEALERLSAKELDKFRKSPPIDDFDWNIPIKPNKFSRQPDIFIRAYLIKEDPNQIKLPEFHQ